MLTIAIGWCVRRNDGPGIGRWYRHLALLGGGRADGRGGGGHCSEPAIELLREELAVVGVPGAGVRSFAGNHGCPGYNGMGLGKGVVVVVVIAPSGSAGHEFVSR
jgi:hypothetical protein